MDLWELVKGIRSRVILETARYVTPNEADRALLPVQQEIARLAHTYDQLCSIRTAVGRIPPSPNTLRAKAGGVLVAVVRRMLFWYTPQIHQFHNSTAMVMQNVCSVMEKQMTVMQQLYA